MTKPEMGTQFRVRDSKSTRSGRATKPLIGQIVTYHGENDNHMLASLLLRAVTAKMPDSAFEEAEAKREDMTYREYETLDGKMVNLLDAEVELVTPATTS